jgi:hypothetical protein
MLKTLIRTTACLTLSAAAFIVITKMDASAAKRRGSAPETTAPKDDPPKDPAPKTPAPKTPPSKLTAASMKMPASIAPSPAPSLAPSLARPTTGTDLDSTLSVPDWKGKRLSVARREARKLGLNVTAVDETGEAVPADMAAVYRVRRQLTKAGTPVEPGADVEVRVREIAPTAEGY